MSGRILMKFIVGQRVVKEGEDSRFEGQVVACFVKRDMKTCAMWSRTTTGCCTSPTSGSCGWPCLFEHPARLEPSHSEGRAETRSSKQRDGGSILSTRL